MDNFENNYLPTEQQPYQQPAQQPYQQPVQQSYQRSYQQPAQQYYGQYIRTSSVNSPAKGNCKGLYIAIIVIAGLIAIVPSAWLISGIIDHVIFNTISYYIDLAASFLFIFFSVSLALLSVDHLLEPKRRKENPGLGKGIHIFGIVLSSICVILCGCTIGGYAVEYSDIFNEYYHDNIFKSIITFLGQPIIYLFVSIAFLLFFIARLVDLSRAGKSRLSM